MVVSYRMELASMILSEAERLERYDVVRKQMTIRIQFTNSISFYIELDPQEIGVLVKYSDLTYKCTTPQIFEEVTEYLLKEILRLGTQRSSDPRWFIETHEIPPLSVFIGVTKYYSPKFEEVIGIGEYQEKAMYHMKQMFYLI
jgi:hypothetical protein